jgi:hypothetical protein
VEEEGEVEEEEEEGVMMETAGVGLTLGTNPRAEAPIPPEFCLATCLTDLSMCLEVEREIEKIKIKKS